MPEQVPENPEAAPIPEPQVQRRPSRALCAMACGCWLVALSSIGAFVWLWRSYQWPPDYRWVVAFFGTLLFFAICVLLLSIKRLAFGPDRFGAMTGLIVGLLPLLFWPFLFSEVHWRATTRQTIPSPWIVGPLAVVASNVADAEVAYRYPRRVKGEWVTLIDRGEPEGYEPLIASMDVHIKAMCDELHATLETPVYWVRGKLLEVNGMSFAGWAICQEEPQGTNLTYIDRHEVAHATIGLLSLPTTNPPSLLIEGWAEFNSNDPAKMRRALLESISRGESVDLESMIRSKWYGRSSGPAYTVGGPFVEYLIQTHGGAKFLELYRDTSAPGFQSDFERVYGITWEKERIAFYEWLQKMHPEFQPPKENHENGYVDGLRERIASIQVGSNVDPRDWEDLLKGTLPYLESRAKVASSSIAITCNLSSISDSPEATGEIKRSTETTRILFDERQAWFSKSSKAISNAIGVASDIAFEATRQGGSLERKGCTVETESQRQQLREVIVDELRDWQLKCDLYHFVDALFLVDQTIQVTSIQDLGDFLVVDFESDDRSKLNLRIDTRKDMQIVEAEKTYAKGGSATYKFSLDYIESMWVLNESELIVLDGAGNGSMLDFQHASMDMAQERSLVDELRSIVVTSCEEGEKLPVSLLVFRIVAGTWTVLAGIYTILFGLFRM